ncbi:hypothetical protein PHYPO_G00031100, partial [Pangasianodon hypophthalmus]
TILETVTVNFSNRGVRHFCPFPQCVFLPQIVLDLEVMAEDETGFREHINAITLELRKSNPSYSEVKKRMKSTLFQRVQIMERPAAEVMEQFPFLGVPQLMLHEMTMRFGTDLAKNMETSLNEMAPNTIRSSKGGSQKKKLYANLIGPAEVTTEGYTIYTPYIFPHHTYLFHAQCKVALSAL